MQSGNGEFVEVYLDGSFRIGCAPSLVPAPGQYMLAHPAGSAAPLAEAIFFVDAAPGGFHAAPPLPDSWVLGKSIDLKGPLGRGFALPNSARKIALIAIDGPGSRLHGLMRQGMNQNLEIALISAEPVFDIPEAVEVQPIQAFRDVVHWADFIALDLEWKNFTGLKDLMEGLELIHAVREAQVLIHTLLPCGTLASCGACAVPVRHGWKMACKDGPVFRLGDLIGAG